MKVIPGNDELLFLTVRIETILENGSQCFGTGFFYKHPHPTRKDGFYCFLVSNKHVLQSAVSIKIFFIKQENNVPSLGVLEHFDIEISKDSYFGHPNESVDVAIVLFSNIISLALDRSCFIRFLDNSLLASDEEIEDFNVTEEILYVGYPNGVFDSKNGIPVIRRGTTASPVSVDYNDSPTFLIDGFVFPGSSGSPVFTSSNSLSLGKHGVLRVQPTRFLGLIASVLTRDNTGQIGFIDIPTQQIPLIQFKEFLHLGIVFKAKTVCETIEAFLEEHKVTNCEEVSE